VAAPNLTPPPGNPRFALFDSLRALAALSVFAGHTYTGTYAFAGHRGPFLLAVHIADQGVAIFFLISGFLLYRPFLVARRAGRPFSLGDYARRRLLRIVPAYWAALTVFILLGFVDGVTAGNWWLFYGFGQIYSAARIGQGIGVAWTLCIEVTFYLALPLFAVAAARLGGRRDSIRGDAALLLVLSAGGLVYRAHFANFFDSAAISTLPGYFLWFALGMSLAVASARPSRPAAGTGPTARRRHWPVLSWAGAAVLFVAADESPHTAGVLGAAGAALLLHVLYGLAALGLLLPAVFEDGAGGPVRRLLRHRWLAGVGLVSYGFYLYHTIVIAQLARLLHDHAVTPRYPIVVLASLPISLGCAAVSFYGLERPLLRLRGGGGRRPGPVRA
jgi:peptidoglycan/LPS O-acetylase OafA/YrhL